MTFTRDNIVGVEFTVKHSESNYRIEAISIDGNPITSWSHSFGRSYYGDYSMQEVLEFLNNGTWIVKNSKV